MSNVYLKKKSEQVLVTHSWRDNWWATGRIYGGGWGSHRRELTKSNASWQTGDFEDFLFYFLLVHLLVRLSWYFYNFQLVFSQIPPPTYKMLLLRPWMSHWIFTLFRRDVQLFFFLLALSTPMTNPWMIPNLRKRSIEDQSHLHLTKNNHMMWRRFENFQFFDLIPLLDIVP